MSNTSNFVFALFSSVADILVDLVYKRIVQKFLSPAQKESEKQYSFSLFFQIVSLNIKPLDPLMVKNCNSITDEGGVLVL